MNHDIDPCLTRRGLDVPLARPVGCSLRLAKPLSRSGQTDFAVDASHQLNGHCVAPRSRTKFESMRDTRLSYRQFRLQTSECRKYRHGSRRTTEGSAIPRSAVLVVSRKSHRTSLDRVGCVIIVAGTPWPNLWSLARGTVTNAFIRNRSLSTSSKSLVNDKVHIIFATD